MRRLLFYLLLAILPLGTRTLVSDSMFLYASDVLLILFLAGVAAAGSVRGFRVTGFYFLLLFLIFAFISVFFAFSKWLAAYHFVILALLALMALATAKLIKSGILNLDSILKVLAVLAIIQALIAFGQFKIQANLLTPGLPKVVIDGGKLLRSSGTFPHPNVLAAFLLLGLFSIYYFWLRNTNFVRIYEISYFRRIWHFVALIGATFFILLGTILTFSRTAWLIAVLLTAGFLGYHLARQEYRQQAINLSVILFSMVYLLFSILGWAIMPRLSLSADEPSVSLRRVYHRLGLDIIRQNPLGVGIGHQVLYAAENKIYERFGLAEDWQKQPIHNIYLLIASEAGILALAAFLLFIGRILLLSKNIAVIIILLSLLFFGFFDHFLWTFRQGQLMLWLVIGLAWGLTKRK